VLVLKKFCFLNFENFQITFNFGVALSIAAVKITGSRYWNEHDKGDE
jgi:hypothetical protein